jgi:glycerophosphoryl diester phosphodiesterase
MGHEGPLVIGHRGFAARHPDNSLAGVRAAIGAGADGVEVDVRRCRDGTWVCQHDRSRGGRRLAEWTLVALRREGVPALAEVVEETPVRRWLYVEVKPLAARALETGLAALSSLLAGRAEHTRVLSSSMAVLAICEAAIPGAGVSWVFGSLPEWLPDRVELSPRHTLVEGLAETGRRLHPWTVDRPVRMRELSRRGVASITTNRPDLALEVLRG